MSSTSSGSSSRNPWLWIPSLYFAEGLPYVVVMTVSVIMYKDLGISNLEIALYTSWLYLPWIIKPFWSPLVDVLRTKRWWIVAMQLLIGAALAGVALTIPTASFFQYSLAFLWLMAFSSATHDIAADGFYMLPLTSHEQAWFVGIRSTFYRLAMVTGQGLLVILAGALETHYGLPELVVTVHAVADVTTATPDFSPETFETVPSDSDQQILVGSDHYRLTLAEQSSDRIAALINKAKNWNVDRGFYELEEPLQQTTTKQPKWLKALEAWIARSFGPSKTALRRTAEAGDLALVYLRLAQPLEGDDSRVVKFFFSKGDRSFQVVEGARFNINSENCKQSFVAVVQVDSRLDTLSQATFCVHSGDSAQAWKLTILLLAGFFLVVCLYHFVALPCPPADNSGDANSIGNVFREFFVSFQSFFRKEGIGLVIGFLLLYRFSEAQLVKLATPFLLDGKEVGGLGLSTGEVGFVYGTVGIVMLTIGGIVGGLLAAKQGLRFWLGWMVLAINLPNAVYIFLSQTQPESHLVINLAVAIEQFGYGFGFTAYLLFMLYVSRGEHETAHYAICTGFMALGMMLPGMVSGWIQEMIGYQRFFIWVMIATIPSFLVCWFIQVDEHFGKRETAPATPSDVT